MSINQEDIALWIIVLQGFFVMFYEYDVWRMNKHRFEERASWREAKRKQAVKKADKPEVVDGTAPKV